MDPGFWSSFLLATVDATWFARCYRAIRKLDFVLCSGIIIDISL